MQVLTANNSPFDFETELARLQPELKYFVLSRTGSIHDAEEVVQETNRIALEKSGEFEAGTNLRAWIFKIASIQAKAFHRKLTRKRGYEIVDEDLLDEMMDEVPDESGEGFAREQDALLECLKLLRPAHQKLITSRYLYGRKVADLAQEEETQPNALAQKLFRIRVRLAACIQSRLQES